MQASLNELRQIVEIALDSPGTDLTNFGAESNLYTEIGLDSIAAVAMVIEIERRFGVRIPDDEVPQLQTPAAILERLARVA